MQEDSTLDKALADLFAGKPISMLIYILSDIGVTPEMVKIKRVMSHDDCRNDMRKKAFKRVSDEAAKGNLYAVAYLGFMHLKGYGVKQNLAKTVELYEKSANGNNPLGLQYLGNALIEGIKEHKKFKTDPARGADLLRKGAEQNHRGCIGDLGNKTEYGQGVPKDFNRGTQLYTQAAKLGLGWALEWLTSRGATDMVGGDPFLFYTPVNTNFTYEMFKEEQAHVHGHLIGDIGRVSTTYNMSRLTVKVTYTGPVDIGDKVICVREVDPRCFDWNKHKQAYGLDVKDGLAKSHKEYDQRIRCESNLLKYHSRRAIADIIREADGLITERVQRAQQQQAQVNVILAQQAPAATAGYPGGAFFIDVVPTPAGYAPAIVPQQQFAAAQATAPLPPMDPQQMQQMMAMMQMMQQNPQYAAQVNAMTQQFQQMNMQPQQPGMPQQYSNQGNNNNQSNPAAPPPVYRK